MSDPPIHSNESYLSFILIFSFVCKLIFEFKNNYDIMIISLFGGIY